MEAAIRMIGVIHYLEKFNKKYRVSHYLLINSKYFSSENCKYQHALLFAFIEKLYRQKRIILKMLNIRSSSVFQFF